MRSRSSTGPIAIWCGWRRATRRMADIIENATYTLWLVMVLVLIGALVSS